MLRALLQTTDDYYERNREALNHGTMLAKMDKAEVKDQIVALYQSHILKLGTKGYFLDKTPTREPIEAIDYLVEYFPGSRYIFCQRRGIDNISSKQRKWPNVSFEQHCKEWVDTIKRWEVQKPKLNGDYLAVDYFDLQEHSSELAQRIGDYLELDPNEIQVLADAFEQDHPELTRADKQKYWSKLSDTNWSREQIRCFEEICMPMMAECGYGLETYWEPTGDTTEDS